MNTPRNIHRNITGNIPRNIHRYLLALAAATLALGAACADAPGTGNFPDMAPQGDGGGNPDGGAVDPNALVGTFNVRIVPPLGENFGYTTVVGKVYDAPTPSALQWDTLLTEGGCTLKKPRVPFCNTPCGGSAVCVDTDKCQPYPTSKSVGTVTMKGVKTQAGATQFTMTAVANAYQPTEQLAFPAFAEGDAITVETSGGAYAPFTVAAKGIPQLFLDKTLIRLESGKSATVKWTAAGNPSNSTIHVKLDISHHGGTKGVLECDAADNGTLVLPEPLITKLLSLGVAGFPTIVVTRSASGSTKIAAGRVDLVVSSDVERDVEIPGVVSCTDSSMCPMGQTCQSDLTCK